MVSTVLCAPAAAASRQQQRKEHRQHAQYHKHTRACAVPGNTECEQHRAQQYAEQSEKHSKQGRPPITSRIC